MVTVEDLMRQALEVFVKLLNRSIVERQCSSSIDEQFKMAVKKVELQMFGGEDPVGWITHVKTYFEVQEISEG